MTEGHCSIMHDSATSVPPSLPEVFQLHTPRLLYLPDVCTTVPLKPSHSIPNRLYLATLMVNFLVPNLLSVVTHENYYVLAMLQGMFSHSQGHNLVKCIAFLALLSVSTHLSSTVVYSLWCMTLLFREQCASKQSLGIHLKQFFPYSKSCIVVL